MLTRASIAVEQLSHPIIKVKKLAVLFVNFFGEIESIKGFSALPNVFAGTIRNGVVIRFPDGFTPTDPANTGGSGTEPI